MSLAQKKARENFKKAIAYRKKTGCTLKQAFAHVKGGKTVSVKKTVKKKAAKKIGDVKREYQIQRLSDGKILTYDLSTGKEWFSDSPDRGSMFTENDANYRKSIFANKGIAVKVIKYDRNWWKVSGVKKAVKKVAKKKAVPVSKHKDTKSHNVNIRVVSGIPKPIIKKIDQIIDEIKQREDVIEDVKKRKKQLIDKNGNKWYINWMKHAKKIVTELKKHKTQLKKYI